MRKDREENPESSQMIHTPVASMLETESARVRVSGKFLAALPAMEQHSSPLHVRHICTDPNTKEPLSAGLAS